MYKYVSDEYCCKLLCVKIHIHICIAAMYNELYRTTMLSDTYLKLQYVVMPTQLIKCWQIPYTLNDKIFKKVGYQKF